MPLLCGGTCQDDRYAIKIYKLVHDLHYYLTVMSSRDPRKATETVEDTHMKIQSHLTRVNLVNPPPHGVGALIGTEAVLRHMLTSGEIVEMQSHDPQISAFGYNPKVDFCKFMTVSIAFHHGLALSVGCKTYADKQFQLQCKFTTVAPMEEGGVLIKKYTIYSVYVDRNVKVFTFKTGEQMTRSMRLSSDAFCAAYPFKVSKIMLLSAFSSPPLGSVLRYTIKDM